jgi:hypothetical protein
MKFGSIEGITSYYTRRKPDLLPRDKSLFHKLTLDFTKTEAIVTRAIKRLLV